MFVFMKNITVSMDEKVARWARLAAAEREMSVSRFVGAVLAERMDADDSYRRAMEEFLASSPAGDSEGQGLPARDELYDRPVLR
jgi:hypothetical protein